MCGESVRYGSTDRRGGGASGGMSPLARWLIGGSLALLFSFVGCCGLGAWRGNQALRDFEKEAARLQAEAEADRKARTVLVSATELLQEFQNDTAAADKKYTRKYLEISGIVERTGTDRESPFVVLHAGDEKAKLRIECFFDLADDEEESQIKRLGKGETITVRGEYSGQVSNIQVRECVLVK